MSILTYEQKLTNEKADLFGKLFEKSALQGYDSEAFIRDVMTLPEYSDMVYNDERQEWSDECFIMCCLENIQPFKKSTNHFDKFELWFMGYLYKYWMRTRETKPDEIYRKLPVDLFHNKFGFYHTQDWDYVINDALSHCE